MRGTTRHICRDDKGKHLQGDRNGPPKGHIAGCRQGVWTYAVRVPTLEDPYHYLRRGGFETRSAADAALRKVQELLDLVPAVERQRRAQIGSAIAASTAYGRPLDEAAIRRKVGADRDPTQPTPTVGEWAADWLAARGDVRRGTWLGWRQRIDNYIVPHLGSIPLDALRPVHLRAMFDAMDRRAQDASLADDPPDERRRKSKAGKPMQHQVLALLRTLVKNAVNTRVIDFNPIAGFKLPTYDAPERNVWSADQIRTFLGRAQDDRLHALFRVALLYGLRRGELLGLRWEDVDLDRGTLAVRQQLGWFGSTPEVGPPKTRRSRRSFRIDDGTVSALRRHRREQREEQLRAGGAWQGTAWGLVFANEDGSPLRPYAPLFALHHLAEEVDLPRLTLHELRHTAITNMLASGINPKVASERAGHATVAMTLDLYGHVLAEQDEAAADAIGMSIDGPAGAN
jgi:integrase